MGELYNRMVDTDTTMAGLWEKRVKAVLSLPRFIRAADSSPKAEETALFVRTALSQIPLRVVPISNTLEAILKGVAINEVMWEQAPRGPLAGAWLPVDLIDRPMWRFGWAASDRSLHIVNHPVRIAPVAAPPIKSQVLSYGTKDNPSRRALLDRLYWVWYLKKHASKYWALFVERFAQPLAKGTYPYKPGQEAANKEQQARLLAILDAIRTGTSIALPDGLDVTFLEASRGGTPATPPSYPGWIEPKPSSSWARSIPAAWPKAPAPSQRVRFPTRSSLETVDHDARLLGSFETDTLIRWMVLFNFGPSAPIPRSVYDSTDAPDRDQRMQGIAHALTDGVAVPEGYYRMTMRVPAPAEGEPVVKRAVSSPSLQSLSSLPSVSPSPLSPAGGGREMGEGARG